MHHHDCLNPADCWCEIRRLSKVLWVTLMILGLEVIGGLVSGSLALLADAGHVFVDNAAVTVAITAAVLVKYRFNQGLVRRTGLRINIVLLWFVVAWILFEALGRFNQPESIKSGVMIVVAAVGGFGNFLQHRILEKSPDEHKHEIYQSLVAHVLTDLVLSGGVVIGGILILLTGWVIIDPVLSVSIAVWISIRTIRLMKAKLNLTNPH